MSSRFKVGHQLEAALVVAMLALHGAACDESDIVLGARGSLAGAGPGGGASGAGAMDADAGGSLAGAGPGDGASGTAAMDADAGGQTSAPRPSTGCGSDPTSSVASIEVDGVRTDYIVDLPAAYDKAHAYPLVMVFRRSDTTAEAFRDALGLPLAVGAEAILVHPDCPGGASTWDVPGDLQMADALLSRLASSYCIDEGRVFAVGQGQGALLVNAFGCARDALRGIAPLSAVLAPPEVCGGRAAVWLMQGSGDPATMAFGRDNRDFWVERNGCDPSMPIAVAPAPCVAYAGCDPRFPVRFCEYGPEFELPAFTASAIWDFFGAL